MSCPVKHSEPTPPPPPPPSGGECPVAHDTLDARNLMPADLHKQLPSPGQSKPLSTERMKSTIPKEKEGDLWEYPSPQMFYNAMKRKGWHPSEDDMNVIVAIHNTVNEKAWAELAKMERRLHPECECGPKLVSIRGLSSKLSPKARLYSWLGYDLPFDRHDWVIDRCGQQVRYVIDYYDDKPPPGKAAGLYLDVRPALDSVGAGWDRTRIGLIRSFGTFH